MKDKHPKDDPKLAFTFDKSKFTSEETIKKLYATKISLFLHNRQVSELSDQEKKIYEAMRMASAFDPRLPGTLWEPKEAAERNLVIAKKLDLMSEQEFLESDYAYEWFEKREPQASQLTKTDYDLGFAKNGTNSLLCKAFIIDLVGKRYMLHIWLKPYFSIAWHRKHDGLIGKLFWIERYN